MPPKVETPVKPSGARTRADKQRGKEVSGSVSDLPAEETLATVLESEFPALPVSPTAQELLNQMGIVAEGTPEAELVVEQLAMASHLRGKVMDLCRRKKLTTDVMQPLMEFIGSFHSLTFDMGMCMVRLHREVARAGVLAVEHKVVEVAEAVEALRDDLRSVTEARSLASAAVGPPGVSSRPPAPVPGGGGPASYARAAAVPPRPAGGAGVVVVEPSEASEGLDTADKVRHALRSAVKPSEAGWQVVGVRSRGSKVELRLATVEAARRVLASKAITDAGLTARAVGKREPRVVVYDVPRELREGEVIAAIKAQNFADSRAFSGANWATFSHFSGPREGPTRNLILRVSSGIRDLMVAHGRVFVDWRSCRVADFVGVTRCWKCHDYGHVAKSCTRPEACGHCSLVGHGKAKCPSLDSPPVCPSCRPHGRPSDHSVDARDLCGSYARAFRLAVEMTDYHA